jgi:CRP/FNR family nitrogen fixation transcriptional regulator
MHTALAANSPLQNPSIFMRGLHETRSVQKTSSSQAAGSIHSYVKDEEIFAEGARATRLYKVISGAVRTSKLLSDGRRQIDAFHFAGDIFGIESGMEYRLSAEAVGESVVIAYHRGSLQSIADDTQQFAMAMLRSLVRAQNHLLLLGRKTALERIATFLLDMAERLSAEDEIDLPMSRIDIADHLGLTIETVSRSFTQLERQAIIELPAARRIILRDKTALDRLNA